MQHLTVRSGWARRYSPRPPSAVLWWSQGADEARTTRALEALAPDDIVPALDDPDGARRWLATARDRVLAAAGREA